MISIFKACSELQKMGPLIFNSRGHGQTGQKFATKVGVAHLKKKTHTQITSKITKKNH